MQVYPAHWIQKLCKQTKVPRLSLGTPLKWVRQREWICLFGYEQREMHKIKSRIIVGGNKKKFHLEKLMLFIFGVSASTGWDGTNSLIWRIRKISLTLLTMLCTHTKNAGETRPEGININVFSIANLVQKNSSSFWDHRVWWVLYFAFQNTNNISFVLPIRCFSVGVQYAQTKRTNEKIVVVNVQERQCASVWNKLAYIADETEATRTQTTIHDMYSKQCAKAVNFLFNMSY